MRYRAIDQEQKQARRESILDAARELFLRSGAVLPSAADIAHQAGLAKGTVYLYFRSKEAIFIALLDAEFASLLEHLRLACESAGGGPAAVIDAFLAAYLPWLKQRPEFLQLASLGHGVLEQSASRDNVLAFKTRLAANLAVTGETLCRKLRLPAAAGSDAGASLLLKSYALTLGLWQALDYPPGLAQMLADEKFQPLRPDFEQELASGLRQLWAGALLPEPVS